MSQIIIDMGSGNTSKNDKTYIKRMYDELKAVDTGKHEIIIKWQLFEKAGDNIPLTHECFEYAYQYGMNLGYPVTASVFDKPSLDFLLEYDVPFIKIANNRDLYYLIGEIPRKHKIYVSIGENNPGVSYFNDNWAFPLQGDSALVCVSNYPAKYDDYITIFSPEQLRRGISDHTTCFSLFRKFEPKIIEWHYVLEHDVNNLDGGLFARTPSALKEVL
jgi:sialic acid synthase SpsE